MRKLITFLCLLFSITAFTQSVVPLRGDTIKIYKQGGFAELVLQNKTKDSILGFLQNMGNGRTEFHTVTAGSGAYTPFGYVDVRSFGALPDSSTDNTTSVRNALASFGTRGGILWFGPGNWVINDSCIVPPNVVIAGIGGNSFNDINVIYPSSTNIICRSSTHNLFVTAQNTGKSGIGFWGLNIVNETTPSAGSAIVLKDGGDDLIRDCTIRGFFINVNVINALFYTLENCHLNDPVRACISLGNTNSSDQGDFLLHNCKFTSAGIYTHPLCAVYWHGSGGMKISDCKFVFTSVDTSKTFTYDVYINNVDASPSDIMIANCSMESFDSMAIKAVFPSSFRHMNLNNIQTETSTVGKCAAIQIKFAGAGTNAGLITIDNINAMSYNTLSSASAVEIVNADQVYIGSIVYANYTKPYTFTNCNGWYSFQAPSNTLPDVSIYSAAGVRVYADHGVSTNGPDIITFSQGDNTERARVDFQGRWLVGTGTPFSNSAGRFILGEYRKDTATQIALALTNVSTNANASLALQFNVGSSSAFIEMLGPNYAGYKNIAAKDWAVYASTGNIDLLADGTSISLGNINGNYFYISATASQGGINNTSPLAEFDIGGTNIGSANNGVAGVELSLRGSNTFTDNSTGNGGTVAKVALNGVGTNAMAATHTTVTYSDLINWYIEGPPTAGTNVTATRSWAQWINSGAVRFGPTTTSAPSFNIPSGTAPSSPQNGDLYYDGTHLYFKPSGTQVDLLTGGGIDAVLAVGQVLTANRTIDDGANTLTVTSTALPAIITTNPASTNTTVPIIQATRTSSGTPSTNMGGSYDTWLSTASGAATFAGSYGIAWTNATTANRTSQWTLNLENNASPTIVLVVDGNGNINTTGGKLDHIVVTGAGTYTITANDFTVVANGTTSTWTFPSAAIGRRLNLINHGSGSITLGTAVTIANGSTSTTLTAGNNYELQYDGSVWRKMN